MSTDVISSRAMQWASKVQSIADQARDLTLEAAQSVGAKYADDTKPVDIDKLLECRSDRDKIDGMRRTIARSSRGIDMSEHFASVVKNVASSNLELRKLVYIYIARYAESQPDLALLSINTIQKALSDQNQIVRALALRVMSSIRVPSISGIVELAIKRCCADSSSFVRKTSAIAIVKTNALNSELHSRLVEYLRLLLADDVPSVVASALEAFEDICPTRVDLLHPNYRRICTLLGQMDEFGQVSALRVLEIYTRRCFTNPNQTRKEESDPEDFYNQTSTAAMPSSDVSSFLKTVQSLLQSQNSAVVLAACRVLRSLGSETQQADIAPSLVCLLRQSSNIQYLVLTNIAVLAMEKPGIWSKFAKHFLIYPTDPALIWALKLEIITLIISTQNADLFLPELAQYSRQLIDQPLAREAITALGKCAQHMPDVAHQCISILFDHMKSDTDLLIGQSVVAIRHLIQLHPHNHVNDIRTLTKSLSRIVAPAARASIFWLVAENLPLLSRYSPDVLRIGARGFGDEDEQVRIQILTLAVKMYVLHCQQSNEQDVEEMNSAIEQADEACAARDQEEAHDSPEVIEDVKQETETYALREGFPDVDSPIPKLYAYIIQLARYDMSYDLRDRLRTYKVLASSPNWVLTQRLLFSPKPLPAFVSPSAEKSKYALGSSSLTVGTEITGYSELPPWSTEVIGQSEREVDSKATVAKQLTNKTLLSSVRSTTPTNNVSSSSSVAAKSVKSKLTGISSLDDFYATSETETSEEEESEEEETEEESEAESGSTDSESEDEEESLVQTKR